MARWWNDKTKQYIQHASPADMSKRFDMSFINSAGNAQTTGDFNYNPDVSVVIDKPTKYWVGTDVVVLITQAQRNILDTQEVEEAKDNLANSANDREKAERAEILSLINELRVKNGDSVITLVQYKTNVRNRM